MEFEEYLAKLDPKTAKRVKTAQEVELIKYPLASQGLTNALSGGIGGGRFTLCYGTAMAGKSVLFQQSIANWQKQGLVCAWVDVEGTYEKAWGARLGINNEELILIQSKSSGRIEDELADHLRNEIDIVVIDSISDITPEVFIDKNGTLAALNDRKQIGAHAKTLTALANGLEYLNQRTAIVLISQVTTKIEQTYVKLVPHGGKKMGEHLPSQIIKLTSSNTDAQQIKGDLQFGGRIVEEPIGRKVKYIVEKNKMGRPFASGEYDLYYAGDFVGIDTVGEVLDLAEQYGIVEKKGAWYNYEEVQFQGRAKFVDALKSDAELLAGMRRWVQAAMTGEVVEV